MRTVIGLIIRQCACAEPEFKVYPSVFCSDAQVSPIRGRTARSFGGRSCADLALGYRQERAQMGKLCQSWILRMSSMHLLSDPWMVLIEVKSSLGSSQSLLQALGYLSSSNTRRSTCYRYSTSRIRFGVQVLARSPSLWVSHMMYISCSVQQWSLLLLLRSLRSITSLRV